MSFGLSADLDNARLHPDVFGAFRRLYKAPLAWRKPSADERVALRGTQESVYAVTTQLDPPARVTRQYWSGFPDPDEFTFLQNRPDGTLVAAGHFDTWPACWDLPAGGQQGANA